VNILIFSDLEIMSKSRAFFWPEEDFTRMTVVSLQHQDLEVWHFPMKFSGKYQTPTSYRDIVVPLLYNEYKYHSMGFKSENKCVGAINDAEFVETVEDDGRLNDIFWMEIKIPKTDFWQKENRLNVNLLTLEFYVTKVRKIICLLKGLVLNFKKLPRGLLFCLDEQAQTIYQAQVETNRHERIC